MTRTQTSDIDQQFARQVLVHLDAAYNLARWLLHDDAAAEDVTQEACLRAYRFFGTLQGESARAWLMAIVRNTSYGWLALHRQPGLSIVFDDTIEAIDAQESGQEGEDPLHILLRRGERDWLNQCLRALPMEFREVLILRDMEEMSYQEISSVVGIPMGTVMSRLSRARRQLRALLLRQEKGGHHEARA